MSKAYVCSNGHAVTKSGTGLGTWHCKQCPNRGERLVKVTRFSGSGKENERDNKTVVTVNRHVLVHVIHGAA